MSAFVLEPASRPWSAVRDRIVAETRGNPLALLELPRGLSPAELAGGFGLADAETLPGRIEDNFQGRLAPLPSDTRRLLLVAAAEPVGEPELVRRAADRLGIRVEAADAAVSEGLVEFGARVTFRHPLVRSAIYRAALPQDRREAHLALAETTDPQLDPDRRAWHLAQATAGPDEEVASELERSAGRAKSRGGFAAAAAFLERATELTPDPAWRGARALTAAQAKLDAAAPDRAYQLLATASLAPLDELQRARVDVLHAQIAFARSDGSASQLTLAAAKRLESLDARLARDAYLEAFGVALFTGRLSGAVGVREVADAARATGRAGASLPAPRALDLLLDGLVTRFTEGYPAGVAPLKRHLEAMQEVLREYGIVGREVRFAWNISPELWDDEAWHELASRGVRLARDAGALAALPVGLTYHASLHVLAGDFAAAAAGLEEADAISAATGNAHFDYATMLLAAFRGHETQALHLIKATVEEATARGEGRALGHAEHAAAAAARSVSRLARPQQPSLSRRPRRISKPRRLGSHAAEPAKVRGATEAHAATRSATDSGSPATVLQRRAHRTAANTGERLPRERPQLRAFSPLFAGLCRT